MRHAGTVSADPPPSYRARFGSKRSVAQNPRTAARHAPGFSERPRKPVGPGRQAGGVYLDPPVDAAEGCNILFQSSDDESAAAQVEASDDT